MWQMHHRSRCKWHTFLGVAFSANNANTCSHPHIRIIYNFPAVSAGVDMDSDLLVEIIKAAPNVCGMKLTCANVGKLTRIMAQVSTAEFGEAYPGETSPFPLQRLTGLLTSSCRPFWSAQEVPLAGFRTLLR